MLKDIRVLLSQARFLAKENKGCESWLHEDRNVVLILDTERFSVVTIYNSVEQYDNVEQQDSTKNKVTENVKPKKQSELHPKVVTMLSNYSKQAYTQQEREYFAKLSPMYKEYGDRIGKLAYTNIEHFVNKKAELNELQLEISRLVSEKNRVLKDLQHFIN